MFGDSEVKVMKFDSSADEKRLFVEDGCQTENIQDKDIETQTVRLSSIGIQVTSEETPSNFSHARDNENLGLFLSKILPYLSAELKNCSDNDYLKIHKKWWSWNNRENAEISEQRILRETIKETDYKDALVSNLSWNSNGMILGIAFSKKTHEGWCNHEMGINLYSVNKTSCERKSSQMIKSTSCIRQIQFHPFIPSILAAGFQNGEVLIWDVKNIDIITLLRMKVNGIEECHAEVVTFLSWKEDESNLNLITAGKDGKILFWKVLLSNLTYTVYKRLGILRNGESEVWRRSAYFEDLHIGFWPDKESDFIVTADEKIFHCSLRKRVRGTVSNYSNPVCFNYTPHKGIITTVACLSQSKFFATCAVDGEIRIYLQGNKNPIYLFHPKKLATEIKWIPAKNHLITWGRSGIVEYYKFNFSEKTYFSNLFYNVGKNISTMAFNPKRKKSVAFGCENGEVVILQF